ncbi:MAG: hypothetical protein ABIS07_18520 [Dokdonella sp.]
MLLLRLLEFSFVILFLTLLVTQVFIPAFKGTRLFPIFDRRGREAFEELTRAREEREVEAVQKEARDARRSSGENDDVQS